MSNGGSPYYLHKDWLGNGRIVSELGLRTITADMAYAPYGEVYNIYGSTNTEYQGFNGDSTQDVFAGMYETPNRQLQGSQQGRWLSPDPAGAGWNQYAYATNPNSLVDPSGLGTCAIGIACIGAPPLHALPQSPNGWSGDGGGGGGCYMDGVEADCGMVEGALGSGAAVPCPDNFCSGFINGQYYQFIAGAGGAQGYVNSNGFSSGLNELNGQSYTNAQYNAYMVATHPNQINGQYGSVSSGLSTLFGDLASADPNDPNVIGGHANFDLSCDDLSICGPGRYDYGIHIEYDSVGNLVVHDDTVSPWISPATFSFSTLFSGDFWEHGFIDLLGGTICNCVFPH